MVRYITEDNFFEQWPKLYLGLNVEAEIQISMVSIAGHQQVRRVWKDYYEAVDVVVFMVDAADVGRLGTSNFYSFL